MKLGQLDIPKDAELPAEGVAFWENPHNGFTVLAVHYTADPEKRTTSWLEESKRGYDESSWQQEFELSFSSWAGKPVYQLFDKKRHVAEGKLLYDPAYPMQRFWDIGTHCCVWAQRIERQLRIYHALQTVGAFGPRETRYHKFEVDVSGLGNFIEYILGECEDLFPDVRVWRDIVDPTAFNKTITHTFSPARLFQDHGLRPIGGETTNMDVRIADVEDWLVMQPGLIIDPSCSIVIDGFAGGYVFKKEGMSSVPDNQSGYAHIQTSIQYGCSKNRASHVKRTVTREIARKLDPASHDVAKYHQQRRCRANHWLGY